jgi:shikimate 5-dehydrogenase
MLLAQGYAQFARWTGLPAPKHAMSEAVYEGMED